MTPEEYDAHVKAVVDKAPPLTPEQKDKLRAILLPVWREIQARRARERA